MLLEVEGFYYKLPDSWEDLTLDDFIEINERAKEAPDKDATEGEKMSFYLDFISDFGIPKEHLRKVKLLDANDNGMGILNLFNHLWQFTQLPIEDDFAKFERFIIDGKVYCFNTNNVSASGSVRAMTDYTFEEYEEATGILQAMNQLKEGQLEHLALLCAIFFRPAKKKLFQWLRSYEIDEYEENSINDRAELFREKLSMDKVWGCYFFLLSQMMKLNPDTLRYLMGVKGEEKATSNYLTGI
jgi:hypothetical protein